MVGFPDALRFVVCWGYSRHSRISGELFKAMVVYATSSVD